MKKFFREPLDFCKERTESAGGLWQRKFFYLFTCEYCFQSLRGGGGSVSHAFQAALPGLGRIGDFVLRTSSRYRTSTWPDLQSYASISIRRGGDQIEGSGRSVKVGATKSGRCGVKSSQQAGSEFKGQRNPGSGAVSRPEPGHCCRCIQISPY